MPKETQRVSTRGRKKVHSMNSTKRKRLQDAGWRVGGADGFLGLSAGEAALLDLRAALGQALRDQRQGDGLSQVAVAKRLGSSQSRVAKMEAGDPSVSLDLLVRSLLALGAGRRELGRVIAGDGGS